MLSCWQLTDKMYLLKVDTSGCVDLDEMDSIDALFPCTVIQGDGVSREAIAVVPDKLNAAALNQRTIVLSGDAVLVPRSGVITAISWVGAWTRLRIRFHA
jgi:hypothetical protein